MCLISYEFWTGIVNFASGNISEVNVFGRTMIPAESDPLTFYTSNYQPNFAQPAVQDAKSKSYGGISAALDQKHDYLEFPFVGAPWLPDRLFELEKHFLPYYTRLPGPQNVPTKNKTRIGLLYEYL